MTLPSGNSGQYTAYCMLTFEIFNYFGIWTSQ